MPRRPHVPALALAALSALVALGALAYAARPAMTRCDDLVVLPDTDAPESWPDLNRTRSVGGEVGPFRLTTPARRKRSREDKPLLVGLAGTCSSSPVAVGSRYGAPVRTYDVALVEDPETSRYVLFLDSRGRHTSEPPLLGVLEIHRGVGTRFRPTERTTWLALGFGALGLLCAIIAPLRRRRGRRYDDVHADWQEAVLTPDGRIQRPDGARVGVLDRGRARWAGEVLVSPDAMTSATAFRDGVVVATRDVVAGGHDLHGRQARAALRDARWLTGFALAASVLGVVATRFG